MKGNTMELATTYAGLELSNPVIAGACGLTSKLGVIRQLEDAGAAAVTAKSLFEEQLEIADVRLEDLARDTNYRHPMMPVVFPEDTTTGPEEHLAWLRKVTEAVDIPVIGSLNAVSREVWVPYAEQLAQTGIDALELNIYASPRGPERNGKEIEKEQCEIIREVVDKLSIPVSVKLSPFYTNPLNVIRRMTEAGCSGFVLFNRLFQPDLDPQAERMVFPFGLSHTTDSRLPLRYTGLLHGTISADLCASSGIFSGTDTARMLLAGAACVQVVSALYRNGTGHVQTILRQLSDWMAERDYTCIDDFRGKLDQQAMPDPWGYARAQYVSALMTRHPLENVWELEGQRRHPLEP